MTHRIRITYERAPGGGRWRFRASPLAVGAVLFASVWFLLVLGAAWRLVRDGYFPYEGTVLRIETRWHDRVPFESATWEHLIVETPEGRRLDRLVSMEARIPNRIRPGDYVVKGRGFGNAVRPRDKKTTAELLDAYREGGAARVSAELRPPAGGADHPPAAHE